MEHSVLSHAIGIFVALAGKTAGSHETFKEIKNNTNKDNIK